MRHLFETMNRPLRSGRVFPSSASAPWMRGSAAKPRPAMAARTLGACSAQQHLRGDGGHPVGVIASPHP